MPPDVENLEFIAREPIILQDPTGEKKTGSILLGLPVFYEGDESYPKCWYCFLVLDGLTSPRLVAGASPLHSLFLALCVMQNSFDDFLETGGKF